jgi:hypothetical protein
MINIHFYVAPAMARQPSEMISTIELEGQGQGQALPVTNCIH